jgi:type I restriction enzyme R subunit
MSNFSFLKTQEWRHIYQDAAEAEKLVLISPKAASILCRSALELGVQWLYENEYSLAYPYDRSLSSLIHQPEFKELLPIGMFTELNLLRKLGNNAAHGKNTTSEDALITLKYLFRFLSFIGVYYSDHEIVAPVFSEENLGAGTQIKESSKELKALESELEKKHVEQKDLLLQLEAQMATNALLRQQLERQQKDNSKRRKARQTKPSSTIPVLVSEAKTRKLFIDVLLKEAGWDNLIEGRDLEYEVSGMPKSTNPTGKGYVDYVLWDKHGKPLAVIEAKSTLKDPATGKQQAILYADCLEVKFKRRPVIFYSNGFETYLWDDAFYPPRRVQGFYTQDELELLLQRRTQRKDLRGFTPNPKIAGRYYQNEAIQRLAENFCTESYGKLRGTNREALLVMATGSGKTRTAAAIVEMLAKSNWVKRVLFLADRNALVTQAKRAFNEHLPEFSSVDLTKEKEADTTRFVFSTYPTIMNKIDQVKSGDERYYGVGHFDLIIIDEAHRSVYQMYRSIFEYFDALILGLTATPKKDIDRNTYSLFGIEDDNPTYAYELDQAVKDGFLVPPRSIAVPLKFQLEGVKYHDLSESEKQEYEEKFGDPTTGELPEEIGGSNINKWLFNTDTVDKVLEHLLKDGLKVSGGDMIGKTIIFARNHDHAIFIEDRFNKNYPELGGEFLRVIDNYESKAQDLLERFTDVSKNQMPQIAVSVDMMDTGVDAPNVLNLVFFKPVKSAAKFWQMIGRGTRLSPNLFGPNNHKKEFLIFDYCSNFEFFEENPDGIEASVAKSLSIQLFEGRLTVTELIKAKEDPTEDDRELAALYLDHLHGAVANLDTDRYMVKPHLKQVLEYSDRKRWDNIGIQDIPEIKQHLAPLIPMESDDEQARRFDIMIIAAQITLLSGGDIGKYTTKVYTIAKALEKKQSIPQVAKSIGLIRMVQKETYWENVNAKALDNLRTALRELIKYLDSVSQEPVYTNFEDQLDLSQVKEYNPISTYVQLRPYKERVEAYIRKNKHHLVIAKLQNNEPITAKEIDTLEALLFTEDGAGTKEDFIENYGEKPLGVFIRSVVGLSKEALNQAFADFISTGQLSANQMRFVRSIIDYMAHNGTVERGALFDEDPFTALNDNGIDGVFRKNEAQMFKIFSIIDRINSNALALA